VRRHAGGITPASEFIFLILTEYPKKNQNLSIIKNIPNR
jgi:hypothetical protein